MTVKSALAPPRYQDFANPANHPPGAHGQGFHPPVAAEIGGNMRFCDDDPVSEIPLAALEPSIQNRVSRELARHDFASAEPGRFVRGRHDLEGQNFA